MRSKCEKETYDNAQPRTNTEMAAEEEEQKLCARVDVKLIAIEIIIILFDK